METRRLFGKRSTVKGFLVRAGFLGILSTVTVGGCAHTFAGAQSGPASVEPTRTPTRLIPTPTLRHPYSPPSKNKLALSSNR